MTTVRSAGVARVAGRRSTGRRPKMVVPTDVRPHLRVEKELLRTGATRLAAMDEVGRGALAGPVTVGVVVVTVGIGRVPAGLRDSKLLTPAARQTLAPLVRRWAPESAVGHAWPEEIDTIGIIAALRLAGRRAMAQLSAPVDAVLLDGNYDYLTEPDPGLFDEVAPARDLGPAARVPPWVVTRIKADMTCAGVAGASVLAKTERDGLLVDLAVDHPQFRFDENKGYGTPEHVAALREHGPCVVHRRSWRLPGAAVDTGVGDAGVGDADTIDVEFELAEFADTMRPTASGDGAAAAMGDDGEAPADPLG